MVDNLLIQGKRDFEQKQETFNLRRRLDITSTAKFLWAAQTKKGTAYKLMKLHASSWNCMQAHGTLCKLMELHASSGNFMQAQGTACKLREQYASLGNYMHSGTFWNILHAFWNILHAFWNIPELSSCIPGTFCMHSGKEHKELQPRVMV